MSKPSKIGQQFYIFRPKSKPLKNTKTDIPVNENVKSEELINLLMKKIDSLNIKGANPDIYGESVNKGTGVVDVDYKKEIYINKAEINKVKSEEVKGKVNNKLDKLRALKRKK